MLQSSSGRMKLSREGRQFISSQHVLLLIAHVGHVYWDVGKISFLPSEVAKEENLSSFHVHRATENLYIPVHVQCSYIMYMYMYVTEGLFSL